MKVFLGGTINGSNWRNKVIQGIQMAYFDPIVDEWDEAAYQVELTERQMCDYLLYVLTPKMTGFYAVAEVTADSFLHPDRTLYCYLKEDEDLAFTAAQLSEMEYLGEIVAQNGATWLKSLDEVIAFLNASHRN